MRDVRQVERFLHDRRIALWTGQSAVPSLSEAIAGRPLRGSWMANPEVHLIYRLLSRLQERDVLSATLVLGKSTALQPALGPAVQRIATDPARLSTTTAALPAAAAELLRVIEDAGSVRMDELVLPTKEARKARVALEHALLAVSQELHTERGAHTTVVRPWRDSEIATRFAAEAASLSLDEAEDALLAACLRSAVVAPEREIRRWFPGAATTLDRFLDGGRATLLTEGKDRFVTGSSVSRPRRGC